MSQVTITAPIGPGKLVTNQIFQNVQRFELDLAHSVVNIEVNSKEKQQPLSTFDIKGTTTLTVTIASGDATIVVSQ